MYDVLNEVPINAEISHRQAEKNFVIDKHQHLYRENAIVLYDRRYTDYAIIGLHNMLQKDFIIRCPSSQTFSEIEKFIASKKTDSLVVLKKPRNFTNKNLSLCEAQVRLIKVELPTGEIEILVTSLLNQEKYPLDEFLWLYHQRWGIETYFGRLKNILDVQRFSSGFSQEIEQDFFSIILTSSIESIISKEDEMQLQQECFEKGTKYQYKINKSVSYAEIADVVVDLLLDTNKSAEEIFEQLKITFRRSPCAIRPNRSFERKKRGSNLRLRFHKYRKRT
ncbi:transposase [Candidatus Uabimicrobium amorphum]|uniref:Transposase IS4-like domain-containing protein n=1 Tax=Uabimicrobium amorphum TaxID=2596890 RepID=A0A5S9INM9_UABAM|nr:transposase [Candidatus Uabimicrobium amorphum]BBM85044.1 hypothetical protein UABAM_03407 [Candidatus Uabimicrobium amorphum]